MTDTPQVLLQHHLKKLKLPTVLREHEKIARQVSGFVKLYDTAKREQQVVDYGKP